MTGRRKPVKHAPDATAVHVGVGDVRIGDQIYSAEGAAAQGFVPVTAEVWTNDYVQANAVVIRAVFARGDAQRFDCAELRDLIGAWLAERDVELADGELPGVFCFNAEPTP